MDLSFGCNDIKKRPLIQFVAASFVNAFRLPKHCEGFLLGRFILMDLGNLLLGGNPAEATARGE